MESVAAGGIVRVLPRLLVASSVAQTDVCDVRPRVITLKSRTVWFPVLHGRGFL